MKCMAQLQLNTLHRERLFIYSEREIFIYLERAIQGVGVGEVTEP